MIRQVQKCQKVKKIQQELNVFKMKVETTLNKNKIGVSKLQYKIQIKNRSKRMYITLKSLQQNVQILICENSSTQTRGQSFQNFRTLHQRLLLIRQNFSSMINQHSEILLLMLSEVNSWNTSWSQTLLKTLTLSFTTLIYSIVSTRVFKDCPYQRSANHDEVERESKQLTWYNIVPSLTGRLLFDNLKNRRDNNMILLKNLWYQKKCPNTDQIRLQTLTRFKNMKEPLKVKVHSLSQSSKGRMVKYTERML